MRILSSACMHAEYNYSGFDSSLNVATADCKPNPTFHNLRSSYVSINRYEPDKINRYSEIEAQTLRDIRIPSGKPAPGRFNHSNGKLCLCNRWTEKSDIFSSISVAMQRLHLLRDVCNYVVGICLHITHTALSGINARTK